MIEAATIMVSAPAVSVPETIEVDITDVAAGTVLTIADITLPKGVEAVSDADTAVVNVADEHAVASEVPEVVPAEGDAETEPSESRATDMSSYDDAPAGATRASRAGLTPGRGA